jgi:uncharacterized glyoxalase superfamily protein PhnB
MASDPTEDASLRCSIAPWLSVRNSARALGFYKLAFGATEGSIAWTRPEEVSSQDSLLKARSFGSATNLQSMPISAPSRSAAVRF